MIDELIAGIVLFKNFILLTLAAGIIGSLLAVIGTRKFSWNGRARGVYGFLINRSDREAVCFAVSLLGFLFVLSSVICRVEMALPHLVFLFLLAVAKAVAGGGGRVFLRDLLNSILINVVQIAAAYLFINRMGMKIMGAGCAYVACRYAGAIAMVIAVFGHHRGFRVEPPRIFRPSMPVVREILRVGLPTSVDSFSVQAGYLLNNSLLIGLGVRAASTYNVIATIVTFTGICQGIGNTSAATLVGQKVGAGDLPGARRRMNAILLYTFIATTVLCLVACLFPRFFAGLFSSDPDVISDSVRIMWLILPFCYVAVSVNVTEPATRAGGDTKYVMLTCTGCVWLIRLPLTWLFCYPLKMGVAGVWLANMVSLVARTVFCLTRVYGRKWGQKPL